MILVAAQSHDRHSAIYDQVASAHDNLLSGIVHIAIQRVETVQALLLLCLWPVPKPRAAYDPSWNYIGLAIHAAAQLGCHDPLPATSAARDWMGFGSGAARDVEPSIQASTWLACFRIGTAYVSLYLLKCSVDQLVQHSRLPGASATFLRTPDEDHRLSYGACILIVE